MEPITILVTGLGSVFGIYGSCVWYKIWQDKRRVRQIKQAHQNINSAYGMPLLNVK